MDIKWLTVDRLHEICEDLIKENKGCYKVYLATGGYYDGTAEEKFYVDDDGELILSTP